MGRCDKIHNDFGERISCVKCMSGLQKECNAFDLLLKKSLDDLARKVSLKMMANLMKKLNYSEKTIEFSAEEAIEKNSYGMNTHKCVREAFDILYELEYRIVKKNEGG